MMAACDRRRSSGVRGTRLRMDKHQRRYGDRGNGDGGGDRRGRPLRGEPGESPDPGGVPRDHRGHSVTGSVLGERVPGRRTLSSGALRYRSVGRRGSVPGPREVAGGRTAEHDGRQHTAQGVVDGGEIGIGRRAGGAAVQMLGNVPGALGREPAAHIGAEPGSHWPAGYVGPPRQVQLKISLAQSFSRSVSKRGHAVGRQAEQRGDLRRLGLLDFGMPEHG